MLIESRRLLANEEIQKTRAKRKKAAEHVAAEAERRAMNIQLAKDKRQNIWSETVFPAEHAARMNAFVKAMAPTAMCQRRKTMTHLQNTGSFTRWLTIPCLWEPDAHMLQNFGSLPSLDNRLGASARRGVRCSPLLAVFIKNQTAYTQTCLGPGPEQALRHLLRACFVMEEKISQGTYSAYNLLCSSNLVIDLAFMRAVVAASKWFGALGFPEGHISEWPPSQGQEWL